MGEERTAFKVVIGKPYDSRPVSRFRSVQII